MLSQRFGVQSKRCSFAFFPAPEVDTLDDVDLDVVKVLCLARSPARIYIPLAGRTGIGKRFVGL